MLSPLPPMPQDLSNIFKAYKCLAFIQDKLHKATFAGSEINDAHAASAFLNSLSKDVTASLKAHPQFYTYFPQQDAAASQTSMEASSDTDRDIGTKGTKATVTKKIEKEKVFKAKPKGQKSQQAKTNVQNIRGASAGSTGNGNASYLATPVIRKRGRPPKNPTP